MAKRVIPDWMLGFIESAKDGSLIDYVIVDEFLNIREPAAHEAGYVQCGIKIKVSQDDPDDWAYLTFKWYSELRSWVYLGKLPKWGGYREEKTT